MFLEAGLDSGKEAVVRFIKKRFQTAIEVLKNGRRAPALHKAELRDDSHFSPHLLDMEDGAPVRCYLPSPGQAMFAQSAVFGIGEELFDDLLPFWVAVSAVGGVAPACLRGFASHGEPSAQGETSLLPQRYRRQHRQAQRAAPADIVNSGKKRGR